MHRPRGLTDVVVLAVGLLSMTSTMAPLPCCYAGRPLTVDDAFPEYLDWMGMGGCRSVRAS